MSLTTSTSVNNERVITQEQETKLFEIQRLGYGAIGERFSKEAEERYLQDQTQPGTYAHFIESFREFTRRREEQFNKQRTEEAKQEVGRDDCKKGCCCKSRETDHWRDQEGGEELRKDLQNDSGSE